MKNKKEYILHLTVEEFQELLRKSIKEQNNQPKIEIETSDLLVPQAKLAEMFQVSTITIWNWEKLGILPKKIKQGGRCYYFRDDVISMLKKNNDYER